MSNDGDDFRPRLGRIADRASRSSPPAVVSALARIRAGRRQKASGASGGYGGGMRRVLIKARVVRLGGRGLALQRAHIAYLSRDGTTRSGERWAFYDASEDRIESDGLLERGREDRHHFRFIVSPEDGHELGSLQPFVRELMQQMEADLGTRLDWMAMDHHDTAHAHTHIILRGVRDDGSELRLDRDYIASGIRQRAGVLVTRRLGPETVEALEAKLDQLTQAPRVTRMDRLLARQAGDGGTIDTSDIKRHQRQYQARLQYLERQGLAHRLDQTRWQVSARLLQTLGAVADREVAAERTRAALQASGTERPLAPPFAPGQSRALTGRVIASGFDHHNSKAWLVVDAMDGKAHYVNLEGKRNISVDTIVRVSAEGVERLDPRPLKAQLQAPGLTWLDRHLAGEDRASVMPSGFGAELREASARRLIELEGRGLLGGKDGPLHPDATTLEKLRWAGIHHEGRAHAARTGLNYRPAAPGQPVEGRLERAVDTPSGRLAVIEAMGERALEFTLVPWQEGMARHLHTGIAMDVSAGMALSRVRARSLGLGL